MTENQKFWWIKVPVGFYDLPEIDWLLEQKNGTDYVILYQRLCHLAINTDGKLIRIIGRMSVPYDERKIAEVTKIQFDTVIVGLKLLEQVKLIYRDNMKIFRICEFHKLVGYDSKAAIKKRLQRAKSKETLPGTSGGHLRGLNQGQTRGQDEGH